MQVHPAQQSWVSTAVTIGLIVIIMVVRMRRMGKSAKSLEARLAAGLSPEAYLAVAARACSAPLHLRDGFQSRRSPVSWLEPRVGWQRGKMMHIHVDPETHALNQKPSPAAMIFLIGLIVVRLLARSILGQSGSVSPAMLTDPLIAFALGMLTLTRLEMYLRARKLLDQARAGA